jgi:hypothetical protein
LDNIGVASGVKKKLHEWLGREKPPIVDTAVRERLLAELAASPATLRKHLRESSYRLSPLVEGVRQDSPELLARTLNALAAEYLNGSREMQRACREEVLQAKQHARWALARQPDDAWRREAIEWMILWLEDPGLFESWVRLRLEAMDATTESRSPAPE